MLPLPAPAGPTDPDRTSGAWAQVWRWGRLCEGCTSFHADFRRSEESVDGDTVSARWRAGSRWVPLGPLSSLGSRNHAHTCLNSSRSSRSQAHGGLLGAVRGGAGDRRGGGAAGGGWPCISVEPCVPWRPSSYRSPGGAATGCEGSVRATLCHRHSHEARDGQDLPDGRVLRPGSAALQARRPSPSTPRALH